MPLNKQQKKEIIKNIKEKIEKQKAMVVVDYKSLKADELFNLRKQLKEVNSELKVVKKTLTKICFKENKIEWNKEKLDVNKCQPAIIFGFDDEISPSRVVYQFAKKNENLKILGGYIKATDAYEFLSVEQITALATLPTREQLLAKLVGTISSPISGFVNVLQGNIKSLIWALNAIKENK